MRKSSSDSEVSQKKYVGCLGELMNIIEVVRSWHAFSE